MSDVKNGVDGQQSNEKDTAKLNNEVLFSEVNVPAEVSSQISAKIQELKKTHNVKKVFVVVVEGDDDDTKPLYIAYFRRPNLMQFSIYMNFVQKDLIQANKQLAQNVFLDGDRELVDDEDLFLYGTMQQLSHVIDSRNSDLVKK